MKRLLLVVALSCLAVGSTHAGEPIVIGETLTIQSKIMGEERSFLVSTPPGYDQSAGRFPVLYMTDGNAHFTHTRGTVDFLANNGLMPQVIIVAVTNTDRTRDLSPTHLASRETSGGAPKFLDFFEKELFPYIDSHYRTQPLRLFSGHSFGGLFALNAFFTRPDMFEAVLAVSPSLEWDNELPLRQANKFFDGREESNSVLFVAMANEEEGAPRPNLLDRLEKELSKADASGFEWQVMRMPDENHGSVVLRAHYWGLRKAFEGWILPVDPEAGYFTGSAEDIEKHYAAMSKRWGFAVVPAEQIVNAAGYGMLRREDFDGAIAVFRYNATLYPKSANVYDSLGEGLERAERLEEALVAYSEATKTAAEVGDDRLHLFATNRDRLKEQLERAKAK
ncbi:MAG: hypothetical protein GY906_17855 [bacterium]|nr:hypothetical protein [bacterium]